MRFKKTLIGATVIGLSLLFGATSTQAATSDMVDVSNHNGYMTTANFVDMRNNYGVKSINTKLSEGTYYQDYTAKNNISTAQQAGLYINGYHFARYTNVQEAKDEADFAAKTAKADGLPIGSVLTADVEAQQQAGLSKAQNDANNKAFEDTVNLYGYRSDVYTMASWKDSKLTIPNGTGWIASYPYNTSNKNWYSVDHGWQYASDAQFNGSYGNFDVTQLYDKYYTGNLKPTPNKPKEKAVTPQSQKPKQPAVWYDSLGDKWHSETGTYTVSTPSHLRWGATNYSSSNGLGLMTYGTRIKYDAYSVHGGFVWIRQPRSNGYAYIATGYAPYGYRTDYWGSFS